MDKNISVGIVADTAVVEVTIRVHVPHNEGTIHARRSSPVGRNVDGAAVVADEAIRPYVPREVFIDVVVARVRRS